MRSIVGLGEGRREIAFGFGGSDGERSVRGCGRGRVRDIIQRIEGDLSRLTIVCLVPWSSVMEKLMEVGGEYTHSAECYTPLLPYSHVLTTARPHFSAVLRSADSLSATPSASSFIHTNTPTLIHPSNIHRLLYLATNSNSFFISTSHSTTSKPRSPHSQIKTKRSPS